jgi:hypothetical protein
MLHNLCYRSRESVVGIATGYGLDDRGVGVRVKGQAFSLFRVDQTGSGAHAAYCPMGALSQGVKRQGR